MRQASAQEALPPPAVRKVWLVPWGCELLGQTVAGIRPWRPVASGRPLTHLPDDILPGQQVLAQVHVRNVTHRLK